MRRNQGIGLFLIGLGLGWVFPSLPNPLNKLHFYAAFALIIVGVVLFITRR